MVMLKNFGANMLLKNIVFHILKFPGGPVVKDLPVNAGDTGLIPDPGRFHMPRGN